jgi:uncharacterized membrane protein YdjX (TVP38/TMEM64 family)
MTTERKGFVSQGINDSVIQKRKFKSTNKKISLINYLLMLFLIIFPLTAFILVNTCTSSYQSGIILCKFSK